MEPPPIVGDSAGARSLREEIERVAANDMTVLILGESGTGKELVARWLHHHSRRRAQGFVAVNCAALPKELVESLLFGHKRGSFTGAFEDQVGKFQEAQGGTIFLDEIGDMPRDLQAKLLRALQERKVTPLGGKDVSIDVRVLAATNA